MIVLYGIVLALFYGIIGSGQILGFLGIYHLWPVLLLTALLTWLAAFLFFKEHPDWKQNWHNCLQANLDPNDNSSSPNTAQHILNISLYSASGIIFFVLTGIPLLRWPASPAGRELTWDAGSYHFLKAVELFRSASVWDLSVAYGDYPFGYESILSLALSISGDERFFGLIHFLIMLFCCLIIWRLLCRYTSLPCSLNLFLSTILLVAGLLFSTDRPWLLDGYAFTIGKNDFLLGAAMLAVILHSPTGSKRDQGRFQLYSLGLSVMIALSVKPNALGIIGPVGLYVLFATWQQKQSGQKTPPFKDFVIAVLLALPGILWAVRNQIILGTVFTSAADDLTADSIFNNLTNPYLYSPNAPFFMLVAIFVLTLVIVIMAKNKNRITWSMAAVQVILFITFIITPATAFHRVRDIPSHIAWRFGISLLVYSFLLGIVILERFILDVLKRFHQKENRTRIASGLVVLCTALILWRGSWVLAKEPQNEWTLRDQFSEPVGVDGYWSAYDYVQKNIRNSVIHIENGIMYYLYGPGFTNTPTKLQYPLEMENVIEQPVPDYFMILRPNWSVEDRQIGNFPDYIESESWLKNWTLIYNDGDGRLYRKK